MQPNSSMCRECPLNWTSGVCAGEICPASHKCLLLRDANGVSQYAWEMKEEKTMESADPSHYKTDGCECIDAIRSMLGKDGFIAYCRGTIIKYHWRCGKKDDPAMEVSKAAVYTQWILDTLADKPLTKKS
jgi:hypothetical protein